MTNPGFELFLVLHISGSYERVIKCHEADFLAMDEKGKYSHAVLVFRELTGMNPKRNLAIGELAENVYIAIAQEKLINQDIQHIKEIVSSNIGKIIEGIINEQPEA